MFIGSRILVKCFERRLLRQSFAFVHQNGQQTTSVNVIKDFELKRPPAPPEEEKPKKSFRQLFRESKFCELGDPNGKIVIGRIIRVVNDDLYIDFGGKFPCVCKRPVVDGQLYVLNRLVRIRLHDLELATRFLGSDVDLTLAEADATLLGLFRTREENSQRKVERRKDET